MNHLILALHFLNEFLSFHLFKILVIFALPKQKIVISLRGSNIIIIEK